ncbi:MAG: hypothetical protein LBK60_01210 [Verrucomicrobiales bacterium]|nr:hypothetical protein [Verrucomicrobiales bacterium]
MKYLSFGLLAIWLSIMTWPASAQETAGVVEKTIEGNLFKNGDMSNGTMGWQGDRSFTTDGDNRVLAVKAKKMRGNLFRKTSRRQKSRTLRSNFGTKPPTTKVAGWNYADSAMAWAPRSLPGI